MSHISLFLGMCGALAYLTEGKEVMQVSVCPKNVYFRAALYFFFLAPPLLLTQKGPKSFLDGKEQKSYS